MIHGYWVLDSERRPVRVTDVLAWGRWFESRENRRVAHTQISKRVRVSTVFIGIDHRHFGDGPPLLFETMVFGGPHDQEMWRYSSWDDAETGHAAVVKRLRAMTDDLRRDS